MRALLLGGSGTLGSAIVEALRAQGHSVAVLHRGQGRTSCPNDAICIHGDRACLEDLAPVFSALASDVVIDAIAGSAATARRTLRVFAGRARLVFLSSVDVYRAWGLFRGNETGALTAAPQAETAPLRRQAGLYSASALSRLRSGLGGPEEGLDPIGLERAAAAWPGAGATIVRLPALYGPGDGRRSLYSLWRRMRDRRGAILLQCGWSDWRSPRILIANAARGIALAATHPRAVGRTYNLCEPENFSEAEWAQQVARAMEWRGRIVVTPPARTPPHLRVLARTAQSCAADSSRIRAELGYREAVPLQRALAETLAWEQAHPPLPADSALFDYASEDAALRGLGFAAIAGCGRKRIASIANSATTTASAQTLASGPALPPVIQREP